MAAVYIRCRYPIEVFGTLMGTFRCSMGITVLINVGLNVIITEYDDGFNSGIGRVRLESRLWTCPSLESFESKLFRIFSIRNGLERKKLERYQFDMKSFMHALHHLPLDCSFHCLSFTNYTAIKLITKKKLNKTPFEKLIFTWWVIMTQSCAHEWLISLIFEFIQASPPLWKRSTIIKSFWAK